MKLKSLLLALIFALTPVMWAQNAPAQEPAGGKRRLSAAARGRIAAAQRARWTKFKAKKGK